MVAVYVLFGSMHMGGGLAKEVVRGDDPSAFGQGVSPVIEAPGFTVLAVFWVVDEPVLATLLVEPPPLKRPVTPAIRAAMATTTTTTTPVRRLD
jgi:hypothetical protein